MKKKRPVFGIAYGTALTAAVGLILLDTFVIPKAQAAVVTETSSPIVFASSSSEDAAEGAGKGYSVSSHKSYREDTAEAAAVPEASGEDTETVSVSDSSGEAAVTASSYSDENISVSITEETVSDTQVYIVDVQVSSAEYLQTAFARDTFGRNIKETTSDIAEDSDAILAINGDYYGFRDYGYVIRNGVLYRDTAGDAEDLVIYADGTFAIADETETTAQELLDAGAWQVLSFGPALIEDGAISVSIGEEVDQARTSNPRTAIGMISPLHYVIVVSDGRTDESEGLTLYELAEVLAEQGCEVAYNLDGGGSTTLWFLGEVINNPAGGRSSDSERKVSDIVYFGY